MEVSGDLSVCDVWRDEGCERDGRRIGKQLRNLITQLFNKGSGEFPELTDLCDSSDILVSVFLGEPQVLVQPKSYIVSIQTICGKVQMEKMLFESCRNC